MGTTRPRARLAAAVALLAAAAPLNPVAGATTCARSGLSPPPPSTTLAVDASDAKNGVVVTSTCNETLLPMDDSVTAFETKIDATNTGIVRVVGYPKVNKLILGMNSIESLPATGGTSLYELDLNNNGIASLDMLQFPSTLSSLVLYDNRVKSARADNFPSDLKMLDLSKNGITSLDTLDFPAKLTKLTLTGNDFTTLSGALLPDTLEDLTCTQSKVSVIEGVRFPSTLKTLSIGPNPVTEFVVRASDVATLKSVQLTSSVAMTSADCAEGGKYTEIKSGIAACVMTDAAFEAKYPKRAAQTAPSPTKAGSSSTAAPSTSLGGLGSTPASTAAPGPSTDTTSKDDSSSSTMYLMWGLLVGGAVLIGVIIALIVQRRKREPLRASDLRELLAEAAAIGRSGKSTRTRTTTVGGKGNGSATDPPPSSSTSNGYFTNDVRNDEELLPYRLPKDEVKIVSELAVGGFGIVYLARLFDQEVVVKQIVPTKMNSSTILKRFMAEIRLYAKLEHPKIARFIGLSWTTLFDLSLVMEYMPNGDLHALLRSSRANPNGRQEFTWFSEHAQPRCKTLIALDLVEALVYLHSFDPLIIHRDLKSKNVLMAEDWTAKLGDFGISRAAADETMTGGMGTTAWIAPEVLQGERYSEKADIYSFGIVLSELDTCGHPYNSNRAADDTLTDPKIAVLVSTDAIKPTIEADCPPAIRDVILSCVEFDPEKRPNAMDLHFRLRSIRNEALGGGFV